MSIMDLVGLIEGFKLAHILYQWQINDFIMVNPKENSEWRKFDRHTLSYKAGSR